MNTKQKNLILSLIEKQVSFLHISSRGCEEYSKYKIEEDIKELLQCKTFVENLEDSNKKKLFEPLGHFNDPKICCGCYIRHTCSHSSWVANNDSVENQSTRMDTTIPKYLRNKVDCYWYPEEEEVALEYRENIILLRLKEFDEYMTKSVIKSITSTETALIVCKKAKTKFKSLFLEFIK